MVAMPLDIKFSCPDCGQHMVADHSAVGVIASCPDCGHPVAVPERSSRGGGSLPAVPASREDLESALAQAEMEIERTREQLEAAADTSERLTANATHAQAELRTFQSERLALRNELASTRQRLAGLEAELSRTVEKLVETAAAMREAEAENQAVSNDLAILQQRVQATETQLAVKASEANALREQLAHAHAAHAVAEEEREKWQLETERLRGEIEAAGSAGETARLTQARLEQLETSFITATDRLKKAEAARKKLKTKCGELEKRNLALKSDLGETATGRELLALRAQLAEVTEESRRRQTEVRQALEDAAKAEAARRAAESLARTAREQVEQAERRAEAAAESRIKEDNVVLRGIVARQNEELQNRCRELLRLKRTRLVLRLVYALFGLALVGLGIAVVQHLPLLNFSLE